MQARRLTVAQRQQLRRARLQYSMWHELDQGGVSDMEEGWQSWRVKATEADAEEPFAQLRLYRIPLNNGGDPILTADYDNWIPHTAVYSVLDGDHLVPAVAARLARPDLTKDPGASMLLLEPAWIDDAVDGAGLEELLWTLVLADLRGPLDLVATVAPGWADPPAADLSKYRRSFRNIGFEKFDRETLILTDWAALERARDKYREAFGFPALNRTGGYVIINGHTMDPGWSHVRVVQYLDSGLLTADDWADDLAEPNSRLPAPGPGRWYTPSALIEEAGADLADLQRWQRQLQQAQAVTPSAVLSDGTTGLPLYSAAAVDAARMRLRRRS